MKDFAKDYFPPIRLIYLRILNESNESNEIFLDRCERGRKRVRYIRTISENTGIFLRWIS